MALTAYEKRVLNGRAGELLVELKLLQMGFFVARMDGTIKAANGDLIIAKKNLRAIIQVKSAFSGNKVSLGRTESYLKSKHCDKIPDEENSFFNRSDSPIYADFIITVSRSIEKPLFHIIPIKDAEIIAKERIDCVYKTPARGNKQRSKNFSCDFNTNNPEEYNKIERYKDNWSAIKA